MSAISYRWPPGDRPGEDTGEIFVPPRQGQPEPDPLTARPWSLYLTAAGLGLLSVLVYLCYMLSVAWDAGRPVRIGLTALAAVILAAAVILFAAGLVVRAVGKLLLRLKLSLKRHMDKVAKQELAGLARLTTLDDDMRTRVEAMGRGYTTVLAAACAEMAAELAQVRQEQARIRELIESRLDDLERRMEYAEETARQAASAEAVIARVVGGEGGHVRQLRPNGTAPPHR